MRRLNALKFFRGSEISERIEWALSDEVSNSGKISKNTADTVRLVDIFDEENEVELQEHDNSVNTDSLEAIALVTEEDQRLDEEDDALGKINEEFISPLVDRTPSNFSNNTSNSVNLVDIIDEKNEVELQDHDRNCSILFDRTLCVVEADRFLEDKEEAREECRDTSIVHETDCTLFTINSQAIEVDSPIAPSDVVEEEEEEEEEDDDNDGGDEEVIKMEEELLPNFKSLDQGLAPSSTFHPKLSRDEEKKSHFLDDLCSLAYIPTFEVNSFGGDDDSILSSAVGSTIFSITPTCYERFVHWFSCTANFQSGALLDDDVCPCHKNQKRVESTLDRVMVNDFHHHHSVYDDSLDRELASVAPPTFAESSPLHV